MSTENIIAIVIAIFGSTGFWAFLQGLRDKKYRRFDQRDAMAKGTMALLHSQIYQLAKTVIKRGSITPSELDDLESLYAPYSALGGNSTGTTYYNRAKALPLKEEGEV